MIWNEITSSTEFPKNCIIIIAYKLSDNPTDYEIIRWSHDNYYNSNDNILLQFNNDIVDHYTDYSILHQPERSKREDSQKCEMRCSEHCGNTVREVR